MKFKFNRRAAAIALLSAWLFAAAPVLAATLPATPATVETMLARAQGGDTIVLSAGVYPEIHIYNLNPKTPVTINASAATIRYAPFQNSSNITLLGGAFGPSVYGTVTFLNSHDITAQGGAYIGAGTVAIAVTNSQHINLVSNTITGSHGDGVDIAASQYVLVQNNTCLNNVRTLAIHPDCVQMWSVIGRPQVSHITVTGNQARGDTQGFDLFDHGTGGGSYIDVDHNVVCTTFVWASQVNSATSSTMIDNVAYTLPGAVVGFAPTWQLTASLDFTPDGGDTDGNQSRDNINGAKPNPANAYPACPVSDGSTGGGTGSGA